MRFKRVAALAVLALGSVANAQAAGLLTWPTPTPPDIFKGGNVTLVSQVGNGNSAFSAVVGSGNVTTITQRGDGHEIEYVHAGNYRTFGSYQVTTHGIEKTLTFSSGNSFVGSQFVIELTKR